MEAAYAVPSSDSSLAPWAAGTRSGRRRRSRVGLERNTMT